MVLGHLGAVNERGSGAKTARFEREALGARSHLISPAALEGYVAFVL
jgi:hypothetical protein